jgi:glycosyltransferase involved in cell wall biosynthesis
LEDKKRAIGIFRHTLLPTSEPFIAEQAKSVTGFEVHFFGRERGPGNFGLRRCHLIEDEGTERFRERAWYTLTGNSRRLERKMRSVAPILLHAHFGVEGVYALRFARRLGIPLITTFHGFDATRSPLDLLKGRKISHARYVMERKQLQREGSSFIAVSEFIRTKLLDRGFPPEKTVVHHIGINPDLFSTSVPDDGISILTVGRLVEKKGTECLIRSMPSVLEHTPDSKVRIVGDGPLRGRLESLVSDLGLSGSVEFLGSIPYSRVADMMRSASIFCLPSVTARNGDSEGMPIALLEASASGKPVIGTDHAGIPEAVKDGETRFIVPERDGEALASRLTLLLANRALRHRMGLAGRRMVEERFDIRLQTQKLEAIYRNVIDRQ